MELQLCHYFVLSSVYMKEQLIITSEESGNRLDKFLITRDLGRSRQYFQNLIADGNIKINGKIAKSSSRVREDDLIEIVYPQAKNLDLKVVKMDLNIVYEDEDILVIDKPSGLVVHPGAGNSHIEDSLVNGLLYHCKGNLSDINGVLRPGIVHRLDKDTSGLLLVAKNDKAHRALSKQFQERKVDKYYYALLIGVLEPKKGIIEAPIGRDSRERKKMNVVSERRGKMAISKYEVVNYFDGYTFVKIKLITGRTHQIRVHFSSIGFPILGDDLYGKHKDNKIIKEEIDLKRQFLHAGRIEFSLPGSTKRMEFESPLPEDLQKVLDYLDKRQ